MKKKLIIGNWKMNPVSSREARKIFTGIKTAASALKKVGVVIAPPFVFLPELVKGYRGKKIVFGAQDVSFEQKGSYTGEVSAPMLKDFGVKYVIVGHSERRALGENNELVHKKVLSVLGQHMTAVLCIGERERDRDATYFTFLKAQIVTALRSVEPTQLKKLVIAYEPVWAIGKSAKDAMKPHDIHQMVVFIRKVLTELYEKKVALSVPILYGGSVESGNAETLITEGEVAGFLVGHASLEPQEFNDILSIVERS